MNDNRSKQNNKKVKMNKKQSISNRQSLLNLEIVKDIEISVSSLEIQIQIGENLERQTQTFENVCLLKSEAQKMIGEILTGMWRE